MFQTNRGFKVKLPIKKKYFDLIKSGKKEFEYRDAHITFICEETGETLRKNVYSATVKLKSQLWFSENELNELFDDDEIIVFKLTDDGLERKVP